MCNDTFACVQAVCITGMYTGMYTGTYTGDESHSIYDFDIYLIYEAVLGSIEIKIANLYSKYLWK